jgi:predicted DNA-binding transcriptional regulator YafY
VAARGWNVVVPDVEITARLVQACDAGERLSITYGEPGRTWDVEVDPWAVVVRHRRWYLLCWSHGKKARRVLRIDRVRGVAALEQRFDPPSDLDPLAAVEEQLSQGWRYQAEVLIEASVEECEHWLPRSFGRLEQVDAATTRLVASTDEPEWYAAQLAELPMRFHVVGGPELRSATLALAHRLSAAVEPLKG